MSARVGGSRSAHAPQLGLQVGKTFGKLFGSLSKPSTRTPYDLKSLLFSIDATETHPYLYQNVQSSAMHNCPRLEITEKPIKSKWINKSVVESWLNEILYSNERQWSTSAWNPMGEPSQYDGEWHCDAGREGRRKQFSPGIDNLRVHWLKRVKVKTE